MPVPLEILKKLFANFVTSHDRRSEVGGQRSVENY